MPKPRPKAVEARPSAIVVENGLRHRSQARGLLNTSNLPALQNLLKRDPDAYTDEFKQQWNHYQSLRVIYAANIGAEVGTGAGSSAAVVGGQGNRMGKEQEDRFRELLAFVTQLVPSYPELTKGFPQELSELILKHHSSLSPDLRHAAVRSLILLKNRDVIGSEELLKTLFPLLSITTSSSLRSFIQTTILSDIKHANAKTQNHRLNRVVQGLLFGVVEEGMKGVDGMALQAGKGRAEPKSKSQALWAVRLAGDLWKKNIWNDAKTVSLIALACFHPHPKVQSSAVRFFLNDLHHAEDGGETESDSDDEPEIPDVRKLGHARKVNKKTRSGDKKMRAAAALAKKRNKNKAAKGEEGAANFAALYLLNDPQTFGEKLFENLSKGDKRHPIEVKIRLMQLLSRVMGAHKLCVLSFYSYIVKYLAPHQLHITLILVSLAQSVHEQTPPDVLTPVIRKLADSFVHPGVGQEVVAAGINSIREIARRQPWCMEQALLDDLITYRRSKDKGVAAAARGLLALYREVNPGLLKRKERGKSGSMAVQAGHVARGFGMPEVGTVGIQGLDLLAQHYEDEKAKREGGDEEDEDDDEEAWKQWELESDSDSDDSEASGEWINVDSEGDSDLDIDYSDSEDEGEGGKKSKDEGESKTPKQLGLERREKKRAARQKARARAQSKTTGDGSGSEDGSDDEAEDSDAEGSDNEDETATAQAGAVDEAVAAEQAKMLELATTRILTPADYQKLNDLRLASAQSAISTGGRTGAAAKREVAYLKAKKRDAGAREDDLAFLDEADILGPRKKAKADYQERMASIARGREDREKFGSKKGKKQKDKTSSTTNEQKNKGKNFGMVSKSWAVRSKKKVSLREKSKALTKHRAKQAKMKGMK